MNVLHLDKKDFWRYPLDRSLVLALLKDESQTLQYEKKLNIWKLNGNPFQPINTKTYSKIVGVILQILHKIRTYFSANYQKKFKAVKLKIKNAQLTPNVSDQKKLTKLLRTLNEVMFDPINKDALLSQIAEIIGRKDLDKKIHRLLPLVLERSVTTKIPRFQLERDIEIGL